MGERNPLEILEQKAEESPEQEGEEEHERNDKYADFLSEDDSYSSEEEGRKGKDRGKVDEFGRRLRNVKSKGSVDKSKLKIKSHKKLELYKERRREYEKESKEKSVSADGLSAIDRMTLRREHLLKKHSKNFLSQVRGSKGV